MSCLLLISFTLYCTVLYCTVYPWRHHSRLAQVKDTFTPRKITIKIVIILVSTLVHYIALLIISTCYSCDFSILRIRTIIQTLCLLLQLLGMQRIVADAYGPDPTVRHACDSCVNG